MEEEIKSSPFIIAQCHRCGAFLWRCATWEEDRWDKSHCSHPSYAVEVFINSSLNYLTD